MDPRVPVSELERLNYELGQIRDRLSELSSPSGTMAYQSVSKLEGLINNIQAQLDDYIANDAYTKAQIEARIVDPGIVGIVNSSQAINATSGRFNGGLASTDVYNRIVSGAGYRATWTASTGEIGYVPSSRRFKHEITPRPFTLEEVLMLQAVTYRYYARSPYSPESTPEELGLIAEEVHDLGFTWLVDYDDEGKPFGVRYDLVGVVVLEAMRELAGRVAKLEGE